MFSSLDSIMLIGFTNIFTTAAVTFKLNLYIKNECNSLLISFLKLKQLFVCEVILNSTIRLQTCNNCLNVLCNLMLSSVEIVPVMSKIVVTCLFSAV